MRAGSVGWRRPLLLLALTAVMAAGITGAVPAAADTPPPTPSPSASTPPPDAQLNVLPPAAPAGTRLAIDGKGFNPGESVTLEWDTPQTVIQKVIAKPDGTFEAGYTVPADSAGQHNICAAEVPGVCTQFTTQAPGPAPTPTPSAPAAPPSPGPSAGASSPATLPAARPQPGVSATAMLLRPPFVIFPILAIAAAIAGLALWLRNRRGSRPPPISATVVHRSRSRERAEPAPWPFAVRPVPGHEPPPETAAPGAEPAHSEADPAVPPTPSPSGQDAPRSRTPAPDDPPDLPEPGD
ncbi:MAG: hypothetical protein ACREPA_05390 [Candidatus Dormibacteraceae bacterium]